MQSPRSMKRQKEIARQEKAKEKDAARAQRKKEKDSRPPPADGVDPDIAGIIPGPQPVDPDIAGIVPGPQPVTE